MPGKLDHILVALWVACGYPLEGTEDTAIEISRHVGTIERFQGGFRYFLSVIVGVVLGQLATQFIAGALESL